MSPDRSGGALPGWAVRRVTPADVGARVTLRRTVSGGYSDVVGVLEAWADGLLTVRRRDGGAVTVVDADVVASRVVPGVVPGAVPGAVPGVVPGAVPGAVPGVVPG